MKNTRCDLRLMACMFTAGLLLLGCQAQFALQELSKHPQTNEPFTKFLEQNFGTDWYGIYLQKHKIGHLKTTTYLEKRPDAACYKIEHSGILNLPLPGEVNILEMHTVAEFNARLPYSLLRYSDRVVHNDEVSYTEITKILKECEAKITQGDETRRHMMGFLGYTLKEYCALQWWVTQGPKAGAFMTYRYLDPKELNIEKNTSYIKGVHDTIASGVKITYYNVMTTRPDGLEILEVFGLDGNAYRIVLGKLFECRLEPQLLAIKMDAPADLFVQNTAPINRPLGESEKVTFLKLLLKDVPGALFDDALGQTVMQNQAHNFCIVTINPKGPPYINATDNEIKKNLAATTDIPSNHPKIIRLARQAVADAATPAEKVRRLVQFVCQYIEDDYTANPLTVLDIIAKRKGIAANTHRCLQLWHALLEFPAGGLADFYISGMSSKHSVCTPGMKSLSAVCGYRWIPPGGNF